ncbi:MAG: rhodanese-like domain-containing protein [Candidatus Limiplasma sp.]|nr:rhodanese-like domain-containing protein [Candidatus Limiplasma sp.]
MKKLASFLLLAALLLTLLVTPALASDANPVYDAAYDYFKNFPSDKNVIAAKDLFAMMENGDEMFILDIRRPDDYAAGHLIGAVNLSFFDMSIADNLEALPDDRPIMVYCYTGQTASQVTALLNIAGKMAKNVQSGFNNAISKEEGHEKYLEDQANAVPEAAYAVDGAIKEALDEYFAAKMALDGTPMANFNISPENVKAIVDEKDDNYYILSIRQAADYAAGHIPGAANIPYGQGMEEALSQLPEDKAIIVYCYSGQTSSQTTAVLRMMGFDAYSMSGGMGNADAGTGWLGQGYEVVSE